MNYRSKALFSLLPCLFFISTLCFCHVAHAQNKAEKCTTQNCVTIKEYQEQNEKLEKNLNKLKNEFSDLKYRLSVEKELNIEVIGLKRQIADDKNEYYNTKINSLSFWVSIYGILFTIIFGILGIIGYKKITIFISKKVDSEIGNRIPKLLDDVAKRLNYDVQQTLADGHEESSNQPEVNVNAFDRGAKK